MKEIQWVENAVRFFEAYVESIRYRIVAQGVDVDVFRASLAGQVESFVEAQDKTEVTAGDVQQVIEKQDPSPTPLTFPAYPPSISFFDRKRTLWRNRLLNRKLLLFLGVLWPLAAILIEWGFGPCKDGSPVDPLATTWHLGLLMVLPLSNAITLLRLRYVRATSLDGFLLGINSLLLGMALYYTLVFLWVTPFALILFWTGIAALPLAPLGALWACCGLRIHLLQWRKERMAFAKRLTLVLGVLLGTAPFLCFEAWSLATFYHVRQLYFISDEAASNEIGRIRYWAHLETVREASFTGTPEAMLGRWVHYIAYRNSDVVDQNHYKKVYYRLTGDNNPLLSRRIMDVFDDRTDTFFLTGIRRDTLHLNSSRLDGSITAEGAFAYLEWTMELLNTATWRQEGLAVLQLPPGAVVSRVTLWVNDIPREAVVTVRGKAEEAYNRFTRRNIDPILVTTCGPDQVLVRCFPVPPGQLMKFRIGITIPMFVEGVEQDIAALLLPCLESANFRVPDMLKHAVWLDSKSPLDSDAEGLSQRSEEDGVHTLRGDISNAELARLTTVVRVKRDISVFSVWSPDIFEEREVIVQRWEAQEPTIPERMAVVIDGSVSQASVADALTDVLHILPAHLETRIWMARDTVTELQSDQAVSLSASDFIGGADNVPALIEAWEWTSAVSDGIVLWLYGPQSRELSPIQTLVQRWDRRSGEPLLYAFALNRGYNRVLQVISERPEVHVLPRLGALKQDVERLTHWLAGENTRWTPVRDRLEMEIVNPETLGTKVSDHLARLWALDEYARLLVQQEPRRETLAAALAVQYRLVTPHSGAVVLELDEHYEEVGLEAPGDIPIPIIPEPRDLLMMAACVCIFLVALYYTRRNACSPAQG